MKRLISMSVMLGMMVFNASAVERITVDDVFNHYPWDGKVDCVFTLSGLESGCVYKGNFTISVKKDAVVQRRVVTKTFSSGAGTYTNTFDCASLFGTGFYPVGGIAVDLIRGSALPDDAIGASIGVMGDVLVIDVSEGSAAATYSTKEYFGVDIGTFNCDIYKTEKIVLKKIPAGKYYCQPRNGDTASAVATQRLTTKGFYIGVFPVTQRQYERVTGTNPSYNSTGNLAAQCPVERVSWNTIRGNVPAESSITSTSTASFLQRLVLKTGLSGFDLPTEAQWEMACRAEATAAYGAYWNGTEAVELSESTLGTAAWYQGNSDNSSHAVGGKKPNSWGLYDMQGNVLEWTRDIFSTYNTSCVDTPCSDASYHLGSMRGLRGGSWYYDKEFCLPSFREASADAGIDFYHIDMGFRLSKSLP